MVSISHNSLVGFRTWRAAPVVVALGILLWAGLPRVALAADACTSTGTGNWNTAGTWATCGGGIPTSDDSVTILSGHIVTVNTAAVADTVVINANVAGALTRNGIDINTGQSLTVTGAVTLNIPTVLTTDLNVGAGALSAGSIAIPGSATANRFATVAVSTGTVTVSGSVVFSGTAARARYTSTGASTTNIGGNFGNGGTLTTGGTGTFNFNGSVAQVIGAYATYNTIQINNTSGEVTFGGNATVGGTLLVNAGTLDIGAVTTIFSGATTINSTLRISSVTGSKTFGDITVANGGTMAFTAPEAIAHLGNLTVNGTGTITGTTGVWAFQRVGGGTLSGTAPAVAITSGTFTTNYTSSIGLTFSGTVTINGAAVVLTNNATLTVTTSLAGTGQLIQGAGSTLNLGGTSAITALDASVSVNEVHYTSTAANQTIKSATYHHLFIEKAGRVGTLGGLVTVNGNLTVTAGNLSDGGFQITGNAVGLFSLPTGSVLTLGTAASATAFPAAFVTANISLAPTSTVTYNSNSAQTISSVPVYGNLTLTATAAVSKTAAGNLSVNGNLICGANNTLADGGFTITVNGNSTMTGTHTGTGKILLGSGTVAHVVAGTGSYGNLELDDAIGVTQAATTNIGGSFTITSGNWTSTNTLAVTGDSLISGTLSVAALTGTKTFGNVTIQTAGAISFSAAEALAINGNLTVNGTGTLTGTSGIWSFQRVGGGTISGTAPALSLAGNATFVTPYTISFPFTVNTYTVNVGITQTNSGTLTVNTALSGAGTLVQGAGAVLNLGGATTIAILDASVNANDVHYTSTAANQTVKSANYFHLFIDKPGRLATLAGTPNVLGNLTFSAGTLNVQASTLSVSGTTDIHGSFEDLNDTGSTSFGGPVTVHPTGSWDCIAAENAPFLFSNGLAFNGTAFVSGPGLYTFHINDQSISGSSSVSIDNLVVTGVQLTNSSTAAVTSNVSLSGTGTFMQNTGALLRIGGTSAIATLDATAAGNTVIYQGAAAQTVHDGTYQTLSVSGNGAGSAAIAADSTANTALELGATIFSTGANTLSMGPGAVVTRTSGFINGNFQKNIATGSPTRTFEIGSGTDYTPVDLSFTLVTIAGDLRLSTTATDSPNILLSQILASKSANRFFTAVNSGISFSAYNATFSFVPTDVDPGASSASFVIEKFAAGIWTRPAIGAVTSTSVQALALTSFSDFQIGEPVPAPPPTPTPTPAPSSGGGGGGGGSFILAPIVNVTTVATPAALLAGPGPVTYTYTMRNIGPVGVTNVTLTDNTCNPVTFVAGDTDGDTLLDTTEEWTFSCTRDVRQTSTSLAVAAASANSFDTSDFAFTTVVVVTPGFPETGAPSLIRPTNLVPRFPETGSPGFPNTGLPPQEVPHRSRTALPIALAAGVCLTGFFLRSYRPFSAT